MRRLMTTTAAPPPRRRHPLACGMSPAHMTVTMSQNPSYRHRIQRGDWCASAKVGAAMHGFRRCLCCTNAHRRLES